MLRVSAEEHLCAGVFSGTTLGWSVELLVLASKGTVIAFKRGLLYYVKIFNFFLIIKIKETVWYLQ